MKKIYILLTTLLFSQIIFAQYLMPASVNSTARVSVKAKAGLSTTVGELTLPPAAHKSAALQSSESALLDVYPNPSTGAVSITFQSTANGNILLSLLNGIGQKQADLINATYDNGKISESVDLSAYPAGIYLLTLQYTDASGKLNTLSKKVQLL